MSEWADAKRRLPAASAEPGRWITSRAEYQRGIMDAVNDPAVETVVIMSCAQVGKTEVLNNIIGFYTDQDPAPMLMLQPTLTMAESWSKDRLAPMLRDTPCLTNKVSDARSRDSGNTLLHKTFPGGHIAMAGANSAASLASRPVRIVLCDEVDRYPASAASEGDPVDLAIKRTMTFWNRKVILASTPTVAGESRIEAAFEASDKRYYFVPCPECGHSQTLKWAQVDWKWNGHSDTVDARYRCEQCSALWDDGQRWQAIRRGAWRATAPFARTAGFHLWEGYSPWARLAATADGWMKAQKSPEQLKVFVNTALGETWKEAGEAPDAQRLFERAEHYPIGVVPRGALFLTATVDVQADRLEFEVKGWGRGRESWSVFYEVIQPQRAVDGKMVPCRTSDPEPWEHLAELIAHDWECEGGGTMPIMACGIDTGYASETAYQFCRRYPQPAHGPMGSRVVSFRTVFPLKGGSSQWKLIEHVSDTDAAKKRGGLRIVTIGTGAAKQEIYDALRMARTASPQSGYCHHPQYELGYFQGLCAESRVVKSNGAIEWRKDGRNEPLDLHVYNRAAAELCGIGLFQDAHWEELERRRAENARTAELPPQDEQPKPESAPRQEPYINRSNWFGNRGSNWLRR